MYDLILTDYWKTLIIARKWACIALQNKRGGMPWHEAAANSHDALRYALMIIS